MEELWEYHQNSGQNKLDPEFRFMEFYNVGLFSIPHEDRGQGFDRQDSGGQVKSV